MAFDFLAAFAGVGKGVAESVEKRNEELQRNAEDEIKVAMKAANEQSAKMQTRRSELKDTADLLATYSQGKLTKTQIAGLLQTPAAAKVIADKLKNADSLENVDFDAIYKITEGKTPYSEEEAIPGVIDRMTRAAKPTAVEPQASPRGAFGLPTKAYSQTIAAGEKAAGMSLAEMRATARGVAEIPEEERIQGKLDMSQFSDPEAITKIQARLRDAKANGEDLNSPKNKKLSDQMVANAVIEDQFKGKGEGEKKPRTASQITTMLNNTLRAGLQGYELGDKVRYDLETSQPVYIGDVAGANKYAEDKRKIVENQYTELGYIKGGKIINDRDAQDALRPYASFAEDGTVMWRKPKIGADGKEVPDAASRSVAKPAVTDTPLPIPKTADGKALDGSKMIAGQKYKAADGSVKTWNGMGWQ